MDAQSKYQRIFLIFNPEDTGYGVGQNPSGYVKLEVNEGKGKLLASVQNLRENKGLTYKLYWIKYGRNDFEAVCAGIIPLQKNRGELKLEFNPANVQSSMIPLQDFNVFAIIGDDGRKDIMQIQCPLAAYKGDKVSWREGFRGNVKITDNNKPVEKPEITVNANPVPPVENIVVQEQEQPIKEDIISKTESPLESKYISPEIPISDLPVEEVPKENHETKEETEEEKVDISEEAPIPDKIVEPNVPKAQETLPSMPNPVPSDFDEYQKMLKDLEGKEKEAIPQQPAGGCGANTGFCMPPQNAGENSPCQNCQSNNALRSQPPQSKKAEGSVEKLRINLDKFFEDYDPFRSRRRDYRWWKVGSPVQLNNILYQCDIKTPLLFNPALMMAHFKYRHLIVGIYSDRLRRREYIVCGVPGVYNVDERPFGSFCRWAQVEGSRPRHGAFGYWLIYIDAKTGKFLSVN